MFIARNSQSKARTTSPRQRSPNGSNIGRRYPISPFPPPPPQPGPPSPQQPGPPPPPSPPGKAIVQATLTYNNGTWGLINVDTQEPITSMHNVVNLTKRHNTMVEDMLNTGRGLTPAAINRLSELMTQAGAEAMLLTPHHVNSIKNFKEVMQNICGLQLRGFTNEARGETWALLIMTAILLAHEHPIRDKTLKIVTVWTFTNHARNLPLLPYSPPLANAPPMAAPLPPPPHPAPLAAIPENQVEPKPLQEQESFNFSDLSFPGTDSMRALVAGCGFPEVQQPYAGHHRNDEGPALVQNDNSKAPIHGEIDLWVRNNTTHDNFNAWMDHILTNPSHPDGQHPPMAEEQTISHSLFGSSPLHLYDQLPFEVILLQETSSERRDFSDLAKLLEVNQKPGPMSLSPKQPQGSSLHSNLPSVLSLNNSADKSPKLLIQQASGGTFCSDHIMQAGTNITTAHSLMLNAQLQSCGPPVSKPPSPPAAQPDAHSSSPAAAPHSINPRRTLEAAFNHADADNDVLSSHMQELQVRVEALSHNTINIIPIETAARHPAALLDLQFQLLQFRSELAPIHQVFSQIVDNVQQLDTWQTYNVISLSHALNAMNLLFMDSHVESTRLFRLERCSHIQKLSRDHAAELNDTTERLNDQISTHLIRLAKLEQVNHNSSQSQARDRTHKEEIKKLRGQMEILANQLTESQAQCHEAQVKIRVLTEHQTLQGPLSCSAQAGRPHHSVNAHVFLGTVSDGDYSPMASPHEDDSPMASLHLDQPVTWKSVHGIIFGVLSQYADRQLTVPMVINHATPFIKGASLTHLTDRIQEAIDMKEDRPPRKRSPSPASHDGSDSETSKRAKASSPPS